MRLQLHAAAVLIPARGVYPALTQNCQQGAASHFSTILPICHTIIVCPVLEFLFCHCAKLLKNPELPVKWNFHNGIKIKVIHINNSRKNGKNDLYTELSTLSTAHLCQSGGICYGNFRNIRFVNCDKNRFLRGNVDFSPDKSIFKNRKKLTEIVAKQQSCML